jgi:hypothetical protein
VVVLKKVLLAWIIIFVLVIIPTTSCLDTQSSFKQLVDKPEWTEKEVIDYLYNYLMDMAALQRDKAWFTGFAGPGPMSLDEIDIERAFTEPIWKAYKESFDESTIDKPLGETVTLLSRPSSGSMASELGTFASADILKKIAKYMGDGLWSVTISEDEWQVNERTEKIKPQNEYATSLIMGISPKTYYDSEAGYSIDYPPNWSIRKANSETFTAIFIEPPKSYPYIFIFNSPAPQDKSFKTCFSIAISTISRNWTGFKEVDSKQLEGGNYQLDYTWQYDGNPQRARNYFILHDNRIYSITYTSNENDFEYYSPIFNYAYKSFRFIPSK